MYAHDPSVYTACKSHATPKMLRKGVTKQEMAKMMKHLGKVHNIIHFKFSSKFVFKILNTKNT